MVLPCSGSASSRRRVRRNASRTRPRRDLTLGSLGHAMAQSRQVSKLSSRATRRCVAYSQTSVRRPPSHGQSPAGVPCCRPGSGIWFWGSHDHARQHHVPISSRPNIDHAAAGEFLEGANLAHASLGLPCSSTLPSSPDPPTSGSVAIGPLAGTDCRRPGQLASTRRTWSKAGRPLQPHEPDDKPFRPKPRVDETSRPAVPQREVYCVPLSADWENAQEEPIDLHVAVQVLPSSSAARRPATVLRPWYCRLQRTCRYRPDVLCDPRTVWILYLALPAHTRQMDPQTASQTSREDALAPLTAKSSHRGASTTASLGHLPVVRLSRPAVQAVPHTRSSPSPFLTPLASHHTGITTNVISYCS